MRIEPDFSKWERTPLLIVTVGLPYSGKTTWALATGLPIVNPDALRVALYGQRFIGTTEPMIWTMAAYMVHSLFYVGHPIVILDATNIKHTKRRELWIEDARLTKYIVKFKVFPTTTDVCVSRAKAAGDEEILPIIMRMSAEMDLNIPPELMSESP